MTDTKEEKLYHAAEAGHVAVVASLLSDNPEINVNWADTRKWTALYIACRNKHVEVVKLLLAHPHINVNVKTHYGQTPFSWACRDGSVSVARLLLQDARVDITLTDQETGGHSPLWLAAWSGKHRVIKWLIASGRDLGDMSLKGKFKNHDVWRDYTALEIARKLKREKVVSLLGRFMVNPTRIRHAVRVKLGVLDALAAEVFALVVFLCDGLVQLKQAHHPATTDDVAARFFAIIKRLPMELQMILCHHAVCSMKQNILRKDSEAAFKALARVLLSQLK